jgi:hypothetical protein
MTLWENLNKRSQLKDLMGKPEEKGPLERPDRKT